ncbi:NADH pyrophosphatase, partial [Bordetella pertussis]
MIFIFRGDELLVRESGVDLPDGDTCAQVGVRFELMQQIWLTHDPQLRTTHVARDTVAPPGYAFRKLRALLSELGERA